MRATWTRTPLPRLLTTTRKAGNEQRQFLSCRVVREPPRAHSAQRARDVVPAAEAARQALRRARGGGCPPVAAARVAHQGRLRVRGEARVRGRVPRARSDVRARGGGAARAVDGVPGARLPPDVAGGGRARERERRRARSAEPRRARGSLLERHRTGRRRGDPPEPRPGRVLGGRTSPRARAGVARARGSAHGD